MPHIPSILHRRPGLWKNKMIGNRKSSGMT
jgi:hypothetical protein